MYRDKNIEKGILRALALVGLLLLVLIGLVFILFRQNYITRVEEVVEIMEDSFQQDIRVENKRNSRSLDFHLEDLGEEDLIRGLKTSLASLQDKKISLSDPSREYMLIHLENESLKIFFRDISQLRLDFTTREELEKIIDDLN